MARGVRRVTAVTGAAAALAHRRGEDLFRLLSEAEDAEGAGDAAAAEAWLAAAGAELAAGGQSAWRRAEARVRVTALRAAAHGRSKAAAKRRAAAMRERAVAAAADAAAAGARFAVARFDDVEGGGGGGGGGGGAGGGGGGRGGGAGGGGPSSAKDESKLALAALKAMVKAAGKGGGEETPACMVLSASVSSGVLTVQCKAQAGSSPSLSAQEWVAAALGSCGGRGGGSDALAQGTAAVVLGSDGGGEVDVLLAAVERAAREWAEGRAF